MTELTIKDVQSIEDLDLFFEILRMQKERGELDAGSESFSQIIAIFNGFKQELLDNQKDLKNYAKTVRKVLEAISQVEGWGHLANPDDLDEEKARQMKNKCTREDAENANKMKNELENHFEFLNGYRCTKTISKDDSLNSEENDKQQKACKDS